MLPIFTNLVCIYGGEAVLYWAKVPYLNWMIYMKDLSDLITYLKHDLPVDDINQAAIILHMLENGGRTTREALIRELMQYNDTFHFYYQRVLDKTTEMDVNTQDIFTYNRQNDTYFLNISLQDAYLADTATRLCRSHVNHWLDRQTQATAPDERAITPKLVRDRIPEIIAADGRIPDTETVTGDTLREKLMDKLTEEHLELLQDTQLDEIADMVEVLVALAGQLGHDEAALMARVHAKRDERGGFANGVYLRGIRKPSGEMG